MSSQNRLFFAAIFYLTALLSVGIAAAQAPNEDQDVPGLPADRGLLANPILLKQAVKSVYFFAGNWRKASSGSWSSQFYEKPIGDNIGLYTLFPADAQHLGWSESEVNRAFQLDTMQRANVNAITMSYWGMPTDDRWAFWAPMHTSTKAHDQLFDEAISRNMVIIPAIESARCTQGRWQGWDGDPAHPKLTGAWPGQSWSFNFASEFPSFNGDPQHPNPANGTPAAALVIQIKDLLQRYVIAPANPQWSSRWAKIYDRMGTPRYAINLLHVSSNQIGPNEHAHFARTFEDVADQIWRDTRKNVGFTLDIVTAHSVVDQNCGFDNDERAKWRDTFLASPEITGPLLRDTNAVLAIQSFIPEVWTGFQLDETQSRPWKMDFIRRWVANGPPVFLDVDPGYMAHQDFDSAKPIQGWGWNDDWFNFQSELKASGIRGITFNTWNGYTEGYVAVPIKRDQNIDRSSYDWLTHLYAIDPQICDHWHFVNRQATYHVFGAICDKWRIMGGSAGALGPPISSEHDLVCVVGARQTDFVFGNVVWVGSRGAFEVHGDIAKLWQQMGGACGTAGLPLSDESGPPDQRYSKFEKGTIHWSPSGAFWLPNPGGIHPL